MIDGGSTPHLFPAGRERERVNGARRRSPDDVPSVDVLSLSRLDGLISADQQDDGHDGYLYKCPWGDYPINSLHGCFGLSLKWIQRDPTFQSVHCEEGFDAPELWRLAACWLIIPPTMPRTVARLNRALSLSRPSRARNLFMAPHRSVFSNYAFYYNHGLLYSRKRRRTSD